MNENRGSVDRALSLVSSGLRPIVESRLGSGGAGIPEDAGALCALMLSRWHDAFADLGDAARALVAEIALEANRLRAASAPGEADALGFVEDATRLLEIVGAPEGLELAIIQNELRRPGPPARAAWRSAGLVAAIVFTLGGVALLQWCCAGQTAQQKPVAPSIAPVTICGSVTGAHRAESPAGSPALIVVQDARSGSKFTIVIRDADRPAFVAVLGSAPEVKYAGRSLCVTGSIGSFQGQEAIEVSSPDAIRLNDTP
jgi:hypothetical protein